MDILNHALIVAEPYLRQYGYAAVVVGLFVEGIGIPAPGLTLLIAASLLAGRGEMDLPAVVLSAMGGALAGYNLGYRIGSFGGHRLLLRTRLINRHHLRRLRQLYRRWGVPVVIIAPFFDGLRQLNGPVAGIIDMPWTRFALANALGCALWIGFWAIAAYTLSEHANTALALVRQFRPWLITAAAALFLGLLVYLFVRDRKGNGNT
ncbi:MAG: DedA family protein [Acidihalobacter sp.]|uniref:DedA family protein n=1 Tax=Acidihalobacter sp. TaxID=1872108 RepID=UPI00307CE910